MLVDSFMAMYFLHKGVKRALNEGNGTPMPVKKKKVKKSKGMVFFVNCSID